MKFAELQKALEPTAGSLRVNGGQLQSARMTSLLNDFLPNGVFEVRNATSKPDKFKLDGREVDAINVVGMLVPAFLGTTGLTVDGWFFLSNDNAELIATVKGMPDPWRFSTGFPATAGSEAEHALFYGCIFTLDSRQPHLLGPDFDAIFHPDNSDDDRQPPANTPTKPPDSKRGLSLTADLKLSSVDETLSDFLRFPYDRRLAVAGPVEITDSRPRARLSTTTHVASFSSQKFEVDLDYEFLTAPVLQGANSIQKARERLTTKLKYETLTVPLAATFDPDSLTESVVIESDFGQASSPLSFEMLESLFPVQIPALPEDFPALKHLALTDLSLEISPQPFELTSIHVRVELPDEWTIVPDLVTFGDLRLDLTVSHYGRAWQLWPYVTANLTVAGGKLTGIFDMSDKSFFCMLSDYEVVDLKKLFEETLKLGDLLPTRDKFDLTQFEISGDLRAKMYALDIGTTIEWPIHLGATTISIKNLFLSLEYAREKPTGTLGGSLAIGGVTTAIAAAYDSAGWTFETAAYNIRLTDLLADVLGDPNLAHELPDVEFPVLEFIFTPNTNAFKFHAVADVSWDRPFGTEAKFNCKVDLTLERAARLATGDGNQPQAQPVACKIAIDGQGSTIINGKELDATINVLATNQGTGVNSANGKNALEITAGGSLRVQLDSGDVSFGLVFHTGAKSKRITATWPAPSDRDKSKDAVLDFKVLGTKLGLDLGGVPEELIPTLKEVNFDYDFAVSQLILAAETERTKLVFLTASVPSDGNIANAGGGNTKSTTTRLYAFILDVEVPVTLSELPLIGQKLASFANMGVEGLRVSVISHPLTTAEINAFNTLITGDDATLPTLPWSADPNLPLPKGGLIQLRVRTGDTQKPPLTFRIGAGSGNDGTNTARPPIGTGGIIGPGVTGVQPGVVPSTVPGVSWLNVQRSFGPVNIKRIGASYANGDIKVALDAGFALSVVSLDLLGLTLEFPVRSFSIEKLKADLHGMSLAYQSGPVSISGGFLEVDPPPGLKFEYNGQARILAASFGLSAIGSFAEFTDGRPSLFLFAALNAPIGGPPFFFVTGIAAGFGYNRSLTLPQLGSLPAFPLVAAAMPTPAHPDPFAGSAGTDPTSALAVMDKYVSPAYGENWLAAGIKFTSFKVLESFALLTVSFGTRFEVALLGLSALAMPAGAPEPIGFAELAMEVVFAPDDGVLMVAAQLTPESYILSRDCHLTGGFAFFLWFKDNPRSGAKAGEFVVTLGGYNPHFAVPAYYPSEPRVGANWQVSDKLSVKGGLYFALTPSVVMAGGFLQANFQSGNLRAWFDAEADFLLTWKPFHYEAWMGLHIGASYQVGSGVTSFVIEVHVGADVHLWGPAFAGTATVDLYVCSFTINFGDAAQQAVPLLRWSEFRESFLPPVMAGRDAQKKAVHHAETHARAFAFAMASGGARTMAATPATPTDTYCLLRVTGGLVKDLTGEKKAESDIDYVVNPERFAISTASVLPCTSVVIVTGDGKTSHNCNFPAASFGVAPVGINNSALQSVHTIRFHQIDISGRPLDNFRVPAEWIRPVHGELPRAAWYKDAATDSTRTPTVEQMNGPRTVANALTGTTIQPSASVPEQTAEIEIATLLYADEDATHFTKTFFNPLNAPPGDSFDQKTAWQQLRQVNSVTVPVSGNGGSAPGPAAVRGKIIEALRRQNVTVRDASNVNTDYLSAAATIAEVAVKAGDHVPGPLLCLLGETKVR